ncbi:hypothetical protein JTB14_026915 [Gonioctena quinquepunctata]|nr:hypothetical protein JTB14_026915 [Gonioctena quinquepunctata]
MEEDYRNIPPDEGVKDKPPEQTVDESQGPHRTDNFGSNASLAQIINEDDLSEMRIVSNSPLTPSNSSLADEGNSDNEPTENSLNTTIRYCRYSVNSDTGMDYGDIRDDATFKVPATPDPEKKEPVTLDTERRLIRRSRIIVAPVSAHSDSEISCTPKRKRIDSPDTQNPKAKDPQIQDNKNPEKIKIPLIFAPKPLEENDVLYKGDKSNDIPGENNDDWTIVINESSKRKADREKRKADYNARKIREKRELKSPELANKPNLRNIPNKDYRKINQPEEISNSSRRRRIAKQKVSK